MGQSPRLLACCHRCTIKFGKGFGVLRQCGGKAAPVQNRAAHFGNERGDRGHFGLRRDQPKRFLDGDPSSELLDVQPIFVHRQTGYAKQVKRYGPTDFVVEGEPGPDWPRSAFVFVPAAVLAQAASWIAMWWVLEVLLRGLGFVPVHILGIAVGSVICTLPAQRLIRAARFRNFGRWLGAAIVAVGIGVATAVDLRFGVIPVFDLEVSRLGLVIPMVFLKAFAATGMVGFGTALGQGNKMVRTVWESSRVLSGPTPD